ncbi:MAG: COG3014 family protein [Candidatus Eiseniibacteriota bacterium]
MTFAARIRRPGRRGAAALLVALACSGCASYTQTALEVRGPLAAGDLERAQAFLEEKKPGGDGLPYLMELGLVLRYRGEFARSNAAFAEAERLIDELYTESLSKKLFALATSDEAIPYDGEAWERVLINYYSALNYVDLGQFDEALVECRKINHKLKVYADSEESPPTYRSDAFAQYLTGILYQANGDVNDAWVSLRLADEEYERYRTEYGVPVPQSLASDLMRLAADQGYADDLERLEERFPDASVASTGDLLAKGEIVVFYEEGFIPAKKQADLTLPILKHEWDDDQVTYARTLSGRRHVHRQYKKTELEYLLRVAIPEFAPKTAAESPGHAVVTVGEVAAKSQLAEDLDAIARRGLDDRMDGIVFKTVLRGLAKYALTRGVEAKKGDVAGTLVNLFTAVTEKADTRGWITLPRTIQVARLVVPPGTHAVDVTCYGPSGNVVESVTFQDVQVGPGEVRILSHRSF